ncbi:Uncharacterised protein [Streptococcus uberis]|nr:Uncharacterised protein [Streptococcus uberis]
MSKEYNDFNRQKVARLEYEELDIITCKNKYIS